MSVRSSMKESVSSLGAITSFRFIHRVGFQILLIQLGLLSSFVFDSFVLNTSIKYIPRH